MTRLPPLSDLVAFDAAARHRTFTLAAREMNVTQPAISRRIALLEHDLGCRLFDRGQRPLQLTPAGRRLFEALRSGLGRIEEAVGEIRNSGSGKTITLRMSSGFAFYWLTPRLPRLQAAFPDHHLRILSSEESQDFTDGDLQVRFGAGRWPGMTARKLLAEKVFAVCSPLYIGGRRTPLPIEAIKEERLLRLNEAEDRWLTWGTWFAALGHAVPARPRSLDFDSFTLMTNATLAGQGIALSWAGLLEGFIETGALVRVSAEEVATARGYYVTTPVGTGSGSAIQQIADWLAQASGERRSDLKPKVENI